MLSAASKEGGSRLNLASPVQLWDRWARASVPLTAPGLVSGGAKETG